MVKTKEQLRQSSGLSKSVPFSEYPNAISSTIGEAPNLSDNSTLGKLALLSQTKERYKTALNLPPETPFSQYIYHIKNYWQPLPIFSNNVAGLWFDPSDLTTLFQDSAGTIPVTANGDPVGLMRDKSGRNCHARQTVSAKRPTYRTDGALSWIDFDGVDDAMTTEVVPFSQPNVFVSAGIRKTVGGTRQTLLELSNSVGTNPNTFGITSPETTGYGVGALLNGSNGQSGRVSGFTAEQSLIVTARLNINSDLNVTRYNIRVDRVKQTITNVGNPTLSTGFAPHAIYLGARGGTSAFFKGRMYGLVLREGLLSNENLLFVESYMGRKTGQVQ